MSETVPQFVVSNKASGKSSSKISHLVFIYFIWFLCNSNTQGEIHQQNTHHPAYIQEFLYDDSILLILHYHHPIYFEWDNCWNIGQNLVQNRNLRYFQNMFNCCLYVFAILFFISTIIFVSHFTKFLW